MPKKPIEVITPGEDEAVSDPVTFDDLTSDDLTIIREILDTSTEKAELTFGLEAVQATTQKEATAAFLEYKKRNKLLAALIGKDDIVSGMISTIQRISFGDEANATAKGHIVNGYKNLGNALNMFEVQADPEEPIELEWIS